MKTLAEIRAVWEHKDDEVILCVTENVDGYKTVYVVLGCMGGSRDQTDYRLVRYFKTGDRWCASIDRGPIQTLEPILANITIVFSDILP